MPATSSVRKEAKRALYRLAATRHRRRERGARYARAGADAAIVRPRGLRVVRRRPRRPARLVDQAAARRRRAPVRGDQRSRRAARGGAQHRHAQDRSRRCAASWSSKHDVRLVAVDWRYADFLVHRAFEWARTRGTRMEGDYPALRAQLWRDPPTEATPLPPRARRRRRARRARPSCSPSRSCARGSAPPRISRRTSRSSAACRTVRWCSTRCSSTIASTTSSRGRSTRRSEATNGPCGRIVSWRWRATSPRPAARSAPPRPRPRRRPSPATSRRTISPCATNSCARASPTSSSSPSSTRPSAPRAR